MKLALLILLSLLPSMAVAVREGIDDDDEWEEQPPAGHSPGTRVTYSVEHSLGGEFSSRATLAVTSTSLNNERTARFVDPGKFTSGDVAAFKKLAGGDGFYRIRVRSFPDESSPYIMASLPACQLFLASFKEKLIIRFNNDGGISALEYANPHFPGNCDGRLAASKTKGSIRIRSAASVAMPEDAPSPPLRITSNMFVKGAETSSLKDPKKKKGEAPKSFMMKYWHIIVPVSVLFMISNFLAPPPPGPPQVGAAK